MKMTFMLEFVDGDEAGQQVQVTCGEDHGKHDLCLPRNTWNKKSEK